MYSLIVTHAASEQAEGEFEIDAGRYLEHTDETLTAQLESLSLDARRSLQSWPCLLTQEGRGDEPVRLVSLSGISRAGGDVRFTAREVRPPLGLVNNDLWRLRRPLDIADFEFSRNHWAVKERSLFRDLESGEVAIDPAWPAAFTDLPLPAPPRNDLIRAREVIGNWSHTHIDDLLLKAGIDNLNAGEEIGSREKRAIIIVKFALAHPGAKTADDRLLSAFIVEEALGIRAAVPAVNGGSPTPPSPPTVLETRPQTQVQSPNRVFVVHGQNEEVRDNVVRFLRKVGLDPIVLHEQPNMGRHLLTKFIEEAELVTFAVILMTDDDVGSRRGEEQARARARQNVILELGYFLSHLGQKGVCALIHPALKRHPTSTALSISKWTMQANGNESYNGSS